MFCANHHLLADFEIANRQSLAVGSPLLSMGCYRLVFELMLAAHAVSIRPAYRSCLADAAIAERSLTSWFVTILRHALSHHRSVEPP
jgi:hypothetical protein